jgi:hypothetical protein
MKIRWFGCLCNIFFAKTPPWRRPQKVRETCRRYTTFYDVINSRIFKCNGWFYSHSDENKVSNQQITRVLTESVRSEQDLQTSYNLMCCQFFWEGGGINQSDLPRWNPTVHPFRRASVLESSRVQAPRDLTWRPFWRHYWEGTIHNAHFCRLRHLWIYWTALEQVLLEHHKVIQKDDGKH